MEQQRPRNCDDDNTAPPGPTPPQEEIRAQLDRILASAEFSVPARVRQFLIYVVNETLAGRADRIKAYSVAVEVFGRDSNFDIQNDPVVRIEAGRLRRALERYYLLVGNSAPVVIEIPKGAYVPCFHWRQEHGDDAQPAGPPRVDQHGSDTAALIGRSSPWLVGSLLALAMLAAGYLAWLVTPPQPVTTARAPSVPEGPSLTVKPFANLSGQPEVNYYAAGLSEELLAQLARFKELTLRARETPEGPSADATARETPRLPGSRYVLEGGIRLSDGKLRVSARVLDGENAVVLWAGTYDADPRDKPIVEIETTIAANVATAVAQPYGVIFTNPPLVRPGKLGLASLPQDCSYRFYHYRTVIDATEHAQARECLEQLTERYPQHATSWAMLSYLYLDEERFKLNRRAGQPTPMVRARAAAERATRLAPENVRALQALMTVLYFSGEAAEALRIGAQARALNPNDTELLGEFGAWLAQSGNWGRGAGLIEEAMAKNPGHSSYYTGLLALAAYMQGEDARAVDLIKRANLQRFSIYHFVAALIFARCGMGHEAAQARAEFLKLRPGFFADFDGELDRRNFNARDRAILVRGAIQAGFPVRTQLSAWEAGQHAAAPAAEPADDPSPRSQP
ncbi:MAG TPA: adenylate cyclase [Bosea sp. (in: a-proteobacteria)]|uniref:adenylate cyclase n=1 Tax=Bosea sp. (in: a-proteobacteria) TaxID=1871050 RepID=UPI002E157889|nr:adenylate cyclase [Bosea sp. (in: a-proteobacteria)]